ncbi:MAG: tRNA 2-thiouridine(34) synthase MnmA [bacterium]
MIKTKKICPEHFDFTQCKLRQRVLVAMSGGVDSSVAAWLLKKQGFEVRGVFLNLGQVKYKESVVATKRVAKKIGIPFRVIDIRKEFEKEVVDYFLQSYFHGLTPNPCVVCNQKIKFETLLKLAKKYRADFVATGHYARLRRSRQPTADSRHLLILWQAKDEKKDQSYFLYTLKQKQLAKILFPLGNLTKEEVKKIADKNYLPYFKKESQDICFLFCETSEFLKQNLKLKPGPIVTTAGKLIGRHEGLPLYTLGQRRAVKIGGIGPFYVVGRDFKKNQLIVTGKFDDSVLYSDKLLAGQVNWLAGESPKLPLKCRARVRYQQPLVDCLVSKKGKNYLVKFKQKLRAITPGQSVVFYKNKEILGGGVIVDE